MKVKRQSFHNKKGIYLFVEQSYWNDFIDVCDSERKTVSRKFNEMVAEEIQKKAVGEDTPIRIKYGKGKNNPFPFQMRLDAWTTRHAAVQNIKDMDAQMIENIGLNMIYASRFKKTGVARDVRVY